jgi:hypothetical protein
MATLFLSQQKWVISRDNSFGFPTGTSLFLLVVTTTPTNMSSDEIPGFHNLDMGEGSAFLSPYENMAEAVGGSKEQIDALRTCCDVYVSMQEELDNAAKELVDQAKNTLFP